LLSLDSEVEKLSPVVVSEPGGLPSIWLTRSLAGIGNSWIFSTHGSKSSRRKAQRAMQIYLYAWWPLRRRRKILKKLSQIAVEVREKRDI
jgi:hypothetical protein